MSTNMNSAELVTATGLSNSKTAAATDARIGGLRHETGLHDAAQVQRNWETGLREAANVEIGRSRNLSRVV